MTILAEQLPDVCVAGRSLAGEDLRGAAEAVAERVEGHATVALDARPVLETVIATVGCLLAGVRFVPVPPDAGPRERQHLLTDSGAELWLGATSPGGPAGPGGAGGPSPVDVALPYVPVSPDDRAAGSRRWTEPDDGAAMLLYTSGTTGAPKGAQLSRRAVQACLDGLRDAWNWTSADTLVHGLPLFHVHGLVLGVLGALRVGSPLVHTGRPTAAGYAAAAERGGTLFFGVPTGWGRLAADAPAARALRRARLLVSGSAGLPGPTFDALRRLTGQGPVERYGMTETLITVAARADEGREPGWVGRPIDGVETRVVEDDGSLTPAGEIGALQVRGSTLFDGYLTGAGAVDDAVDDAGWFTTGDAALVDDDGRHKIIGRVRDDLISSGGYRIGAGEIEAVLLSHPAVSDVAVVGEPDSDLGQRIVAYVVGESVDPQVLIDLVATDLSAHKRPREVRFVAELPRNAMGKVRKASLAPAS